MAVKIRLKRAGAKKQPFYRVVVADSRAPRDGKFIEEIGTYNPLTNPKEVNVDPARAQYWVGTGAKPTDTVDRLFKEHGIYDAEIEVEEGNEETDEIDKETESQDTEEQHSENTED